MKEIKEFQTESKELLNLVINSIYSNKEIFLRELISNASDAIDKYKFLSLKSENNLPTKNHSIELVPNTEERTLKIIDTGIGMSREDLITNLGTIAKSGSKEFLTKLKDAKDIKDLNIIGQFGVGFYSAFMVADKIEVLTRAKDDKAYLFTSDGKDSYSIEDGSKETIGTEITIYLKQNSEDEDYDKYTSTYELEDLVKRYSDFIRYPIIMNVKTSKHKQDSEGKDIPDQYEDIIETKTLNSMIPLWKKNKKEITEEQLKEFYKSRFNEYEDPWTSMNIKVDGLVCYDSLIFIPGHAPYDLYSDSYEKGLALYAKGVFIEEKCKSLVPDYLKFVKGLVDSDDFSLNVSREILQDTAKLNKIRDNIEKKVVEQLKDIKEHDYDKYLQFFKIYGANLKYGIYSSYGSKKDQLSDLLVYNSLNSEKMISLKDYKGGMKEDQKYIYFAAGKSLEDIKALPQLEKFKKAGINVLLLSENIDEFTLLMMKDYDKVEFKSISEENADMASEEEKEKISTLAAQNKEVLDLVKDSLKDKVDDIILSSKLVEAPVCISTVDGLSLNMEQVLKETNQSDERIKAKKVLEINPDHKLFEILKTVKDDKNRVEALSKVLYYEANLLEGVELKDKSDFVNNLNSLLSEIK